jgi:hypothetical protein
MEIVGNSSFQRRRAVAVSVALLTALLSGFAPATAYAETVVVEGTVEGCVITISGTGTVDLGSPTLVSPEGSSSYWEFDTTPAALPAFKVDWSTGSANDCAGSLHAQHGGITKTVGETTNSSLGAVLRLSLVGESGWMPLNDNTPALVATSDGSNSGDSSDFDAMLTVDTSEGNGDYSATITFTVAP